ncbi:hypothetical protein ABLE68_14315 [Nocardioides sp. CN2-186]|uniref:hypothetical protein n=1 Tax=Nocardioides tweenelious TaxID=3156607 RepID=UPI0032B47DC0
MSKRCLLTIARQELTRAAHAPQGRSERVLVGEEGRSRLSILALRPDVSAVQLDQPWTVQVLAGRIRVQHGSVVSVGYPGDLIVGPAGGSLWSGGDCVVLLSLEHRAAPGTEMAMSAS